MTTKLIKKVTHVIFDMDGVLLDTETLYTKATQNILDKFGDKKFTWEVKTQMMGLHGIEVAKKMVEIFELPITPKEYYELARKEYATIMPACQMMRGAANLVKHLKANKVPIAVATSSSHQSFELKTRNHRELFAAFDHIVCGGSDPEVKRGKPHPDIFLVCASRFCDQPCTEQCLVFEDAPNGVAAAVKAGMQAVMVPDENVPNELRKEATVVVNSLEEVPLELFGLPALQNSCT